MFGTHIVDFNDTSLQSVGPYDFGHFSVPVLSQAWPMDQTWERIEAKTALE